MFNLINTLETQYIPVLQYYMILVMYNCVWWCTCMLMCRIHACMKVHLLMCRDQWSPIFLNHSLLYCLAQNFSLNPELTDLPRLSDQCTPGILFPLPQLSAGGQGLATRQLFYVGPQDLSPGPHLPGLNLGFTVAA